MSTIWFYAQHFSFQDTHTHTSSNLRVYRMSDLQIDKALIETLKLMKLIVPQINIYFANIEGPESQCRNLFLFPYEITQCCLDLQFIFS